MSDMRSRTLTFGLVVFALAALGWVALSWVKFLDESTRRRHDIMIACTKEGELLSQEHLKAGYGNNISSLNQLLKTAYEDCLKLHGVKPAPK